MFRWRYLDADGREAGASARFDAREDAEAWLGESWADLLDEGIEDAELMDDDTGEALYRMGLGDA